MPFAPGNTIWVGRKHSPETIAKMRSVFKRTPEQRRKLSEAKIGIKLSPERARRCAEILRKFNSKRGAEHPAWRGGTTTINERIRNSVEYKNWRSAVFKRDGFACVRGGAAHGTKLNADHIKSFAHYPELRFDVANGRTLCESCHRATETWGSHKKK